MNDRELLELAAKAAGIKLLFSTEPGMSPREANSLLYWNPLTDDGDALRLAVRLRLELTFDEWTDGETVIVTFKRVIEAENIQASDPYAATRRAIVRAAAEIGRGTP